MNTEKKTGLIVKLFMGFIVGLAVSLLNTMMSGFFDIKLWLINFGIGFVLSAIIGLIIPVRKIDRGLHNKIKNSFGASFLSGFIANLIYVPAVTAVMTFVMVTLILNSMDSAVSNMQNRKAELENSVVQITEERANLETEHSTL